MDSKPLGTAARELPQISTQESSLTLPSFTADDAFFLGTSLRTRLSALAPTPAVINIALANSSQLLYHAVSRPGPGTSPDNDVWVSRKRKTVLRWGCSSWYMHNKFGGDEKAFAEKYGLGSGAGEYAIHGGGVPVRVRGVEGVVVVVVVVSGLRQEEDHMVVVEGLEELRETQEKKKKEGDGVRG